MRNKPIAASSSRSVRATARLTP
ncbi:hypothetical protein STRIP9103_00493, partial [Streptomyces ipomoeae 91-03]